MDHSDADDTRDNARDTTNTVTTQATTTASTGSSTSHGPNTHKRRVSGGLLSRVPFLRSQDEQRSAKKSQDGEISKELENSRPHDDEKCGGGLTQAFRQTKTRKRKGSLRKTAMLGRERKNSSRSRQSFDADGTFHDEPSNNESTHQVPQKHMPQVGTTTYTKETVTAQSDSTSEMVDTPRVNNLLSPITTSHNAYISTTDDDADPISSFTRPPTSINSAVTNQSYFPSSTIPVPLLRRRSTARQHPSHSSPLSRPPVTQEDEWDYTETEWWGWVVLVVTWIVFVVGMGSCLGVWSWAWDVGETPYAPPELEDDDTLPIVGYYPALIVLTAVMAWVWVVVAWVGMKYFRHAKVMVGEEG